MLDERDIITSRQNPTVKRICALLDKKSRRVEGLFRFDGIKLFGEALDCGLKVRYAVLSSGASDEIRARVERAVADRRLEGSALILVSDAVFEKISEERSPEGIITVAELPRERHRELDAEAADTYCVQKSERILIAEALRDPGNLGTVIRSCAALGIDRLILSGDCADLYNPKAVRAAMGGLFRLNVDIIPVQAMPAAIASLRRGGRKVYAAALGRDALEIGAIGLSRGDCFVIGNEGHGLCEHTINACDACAVIPMRAGCESLNAAAAAAICIWETVKAD